MTDQPFIISFVCSPKCLKVLDCHSMYNIMFPTNMRVMLPILLMITPQYIALSGSYNAQNNYKIWQTQFKEVQWAKVGSIYHNDTSMMHGIILEFLSLF